jgi:hypothetical protein
MSVTHSNSSRVPEPPPGGAASPEDKNAVVWSKLIFADGTTVWTRGGPAADHIFHPVMLKYVLICVLLYALLQNRAGLEEMAVWQISIYWLLVTVVSVFWLFIAASIANRLLQRKTIRFVFTPLISLPLIVVVEVFFQIYLVWGLGQSFGGLESIAPYVARDFMVILLFDIQYGTFVAPHNPAYRMSDPRLDTSIAQKVWAPEGAVQELRFARPVTPEPAVLEPPRPLEVSAPARETPAALAPALMPPPASVTEQPEDMAAAQQPERALPAPAMAEQTIEWAGERLKVADLLVIKAEDHYVRLLLRGRSHLLRGRFSDVIAAMPPDMGIALNRSVWVAVAGVRTLHRTSDHRLLVMAVDDQLHAVARARKAGVLEFARRHGLPIARRKLQASDPE